MRSISPSARSRRRALLTAATAGAAGMLALAPAAAFADVDFTTAAGVVGSPWPSSSDGPPLVVAPRVDTVDTISGTVVHDAPANYTNPVPENFFVTAQTFTVGSAFKLGQISLWGNGGPQ